MKSNLSLTRGLIWPCLWSNGEKIMEDSFVPMGMKRLSSPFLNSSSMIWAINKTSTLAEEANYF